MIPLFSTALFPPIRYFAIIAANEKAFIEAHENYLKQSYRNRYEILSANGKLSLSVPVLEGSFHKKEIGDIKIDYSKRWQQIHLRSIEAAYKSSPFYLFYANEISSVIYSGKTYLIDLNQLALETLLSITGTKTAISFTGSFSPASVHETDFRYSISPKLRVNNTLNWKAINYNQVFGDRFGFIPFLSILDLLFNIGPDTKEFLLSEFALNKPLK